ncbi:MAG: diguanylate cyclase [Acidimicrobiales bacterium]|nr:diguanylate cyclase [Acidimicrobiales bacterium]
MTPGPKVEQTALLGARPGVGASSLARLLREFQVELLEAPSMHLRAVVDAQLGRVGALLGASRLTLWQVEAEGDAATAEFEWFRSPCEPFRNMRLELDRFPLPAAALTGGAPAVVLDEAATRFFGVTEVLVVPLASRGRLLRFLTVGWVERPHAEHAAIGIDPGVLDALYSLTAVVHGTAETAVLAERASYDELTGLANRRLLLFMLNHLLSRLGRRRGGGVAVIFCEVDEQSVPEDAIVRLARSFHHETRATDVVGRFDERVLAVLCDDLRDPAEAVEVARRLARVCRDEAEQAGLPGRVACFGIGYSDESVAPGMLLRRADLATYQARADELERIKVVAE